MDVGSGWMARQVGWLAWWAQWPGGMAGQVGLAVSVIREQWTC